VLHDGEGFCDAPGVRVVAGRFLRDLYDGRASSYKGCSTSPTGADAAMQPHSQAFPVLTFVGVVVQLGGALLLIALFLTLRRFVIRRAYFTAWAMAWTAFAVAIVALAVRYGLVPGLIGTQLEETSVAARCLYLVYQASKVVGLVFFVRGTMIYLVGTTAGVRATRHLWLLAALFGVVSAVFVRRGVEELVVWQSAIAFPVFGYCALTMLSLPRPRQTAGSTATGVAFALLGALWCVYGGVFLAVVLDSSIPVAGIARWLATCNPYLDLSFDVVLGYSMILLLMEDAKREVDDAQAELRLTHDRLRRAALYDALTDSLNRRAFSEGVGLDMVRKTFGTVVIADVDNLKRANDQHGHAVGDQLIRRCAEVLRGALRPYDKLYRWGGDEFLVVLPSAHASNVLDRLRRAIDAATPASTRSGETIPLQVSLGTADYTSFEQLTTAIERADREMYVEKRARRSPARRDSSGARAVTPPPLRAVR
jgi:diguanylate cyclase (GGDEF)-like protein